MDADSARPRILLADDNFTTQQVLRLSLAGEDIDVECVETGEAALQNMEEEPARVLLSNIYLPDMDGYELCRRLRESGYGRTPVIMLVGAFQSFDEEKARDVGCQHSLSKPFDTFALVSLVRQLIESHPPVEEPETAGPFVFDVPVAETAGQTLFELDLKDCLSRPARLEREITVGDLPRIEFTQIPDFSEASEPGSASVDHERLLAKLSERIPEAIRKVLPDILKELDETR